uniref:Glycosyltransferase n=1 Tax=Ilex asprella TaxID=185493 RepID=A0A6B9MEW2_9AQUA|nr:AU1 [Ilex asprella]
MEKEKACKAHVVVLAYHGQGHINPIVQFSKRLASKGIKVTVTTILSTTKTMQATAGSITFESIYDDCSEGGTAGAGGFKGFLDRFEASGSQNLTELIRKQENSDYPVKCLVYDANIPWASNIFKQFAIPGAAFFTQSCAAIASYYPMYCEMSGEPVPGPDFPLSGLPAPVIPNMPSMGPTTGRFPPMFLNILSQFTNIEKAEWVLFNSFDKLEEEVVKWMSNLWPIRTIGPTVPSIYLDKRVENDNGYGFNMYKPDTDACMKWLNTKETGSVVYVCFGSAASLHVEQMAEMAEALRQTSSSFLWAVKPSEQSKLPTNFVEETSENGLVVTWCPQLEVLAHQAVGCFISHCGWNSTAEAISFGVPMVAMPQFLDQMTNAHFVEQVWGVGVKPKADEKGLTNSLEIGECINLIMNGERGQEIKKKAIRWKELAKQAIDEGGSSDKYIDEIVARLVAN